MFPDRRKVTHFLTFPPPIKAAARQSKYVFLEANGQDV